MSYLRVWKKQEKRIVRLMYRKGLISVDLNNLYWEAYRPYCKVNRKGKYSFRHMVYLPEINFFVIDYWGEVLEHGLVGRFLDSYYWMNVSISDDGEVDDSSYRGFTRMGLIRYLESLPTVVNDSKINKVLRRWTY